MKKQKIHYRQGSDDYWFDEFLCGIDMFVKRKALSMTFHNNIKKVTCKRCRQVYRSRK